MNEAETRAEYIDPLLKASGWGEVEDSKVLREFRITDGRIRSGGKRDKPEIADYFLVYKNRKIGVFEIYITDSQCLHLGNAQPRSVGEQKHAFVLRVC